MNNIILLNKDHSIKIISEKDFEYLKNIKYILIPITSYCANTHIMLKPNEYMNFTKAIIKVKLLYKWFNYSENDSYIKEFSQIEKEITSLTELFNMLHSINRMNYVNYISSTSTCFDTLNSIDLKEVEITLYKHKKVIFHKNVIKEFRKPSKEHLNLLDILDELNDIYKLKDDDLGNNDYLILDSTRGIWNISKQSYNKELIYGLRLFETSSIYFLEYNLMSILDNIDNIFINSFIVKDERMFNPKTFDIEEDINEYEMYDELQYSRGDYSINDIIEYFLYVNMIYLNMLMIYQNFIFENNYEKDYFDIITNIRLINSYTKKAINMVFDKNKIPTILDFFKFIIRGWGE